MVRGMYLFKCAQGAKKPSAAEEQETSPKEMSVRRRNGVRPPPQFLTMDTAPKIASYCSIKGVVRI